MRTVPFGPTDAGVPNVIADMMRIADRADADIRQLYTAARQTGIDFFDHVDPGHYDRPLRLSARSESSRGPLLLSDISREDRLSEGQAGSEQVGEVHRCRLFKSLLPSPDFPPTLRVCWHL